MLFKGLFSAHPYQQWELSLKKKILAKLIGKKKWHLNLICIALITVTVEHLATLGILHMTL